MIKLTTKPIESSTYLITITFKDLDGQLFTPKTFQWTLSDAKGTIINERDKVVEVVVGTSHNIVLSGDDLVFAAGKTKGSRVFTIEGTYDSIYGDDLPYREEASFTILDTVINA
jgi:hypothetical protein